MLSDAVARTLPLRNILARRLGFGRDLDHAALREDILQPEEVEEVPLPLCLAGQLSAVTGTSVHDRLEDQLAAARARQLRHAAVVRYTLTDCVVHAKGAEWARGSLRTERLRPRDLLAGALQETAEAHYPMSPVSRRYFGHFLRDACTNALLRQPGQDLLLDVPEEWPDAGAYVRAFGIEAVPGVPHLVRRLTICADHGQGSLKRRRYRVLRGKIDAAFGARGARHEDVYLRRGEGGAMQRPIRNEEALIELLAKRGFRIVTVGASVAELAGQLRTCRRIVSMEGSHVNHAYFLAPAGVDVCLLMPADRFTLIHRGIAQASGGRFGFVVCPRVGGFYEVDAGQLQRTLDLF